MRCMSFALTTPQVLSANKTCTRRLGWKDLQVGTLLWAVEKSQGLKRGEKVRRLAVIEVVDNRQEPLRRLTDDERYGREGCRQEGFPDLSPEEFLDYFCRTNRGCEPDTIITRIGFRYVIRPEASS
jgi:hypothetical protein